VATHPRCSEAVVESRTFGRVEDKSWERVEHWWADAFGVPVSMLWEKGVTIGFHAGLGDYPGIVVAGRKKAAHVSLPDWVDQKLADKIAKHDVDELLDRRFWLDFGPLRSGYRVSPLMVHAYTDHQHETPNKVEQVAFEDVARWRDLVSSKKWEASGFADQVTHVFAVRSGKDIAAAANLSKFLGGSSNVGVLTHPKYRGKGYAAPVTRAATAYAVRNEGMARFRYDADHARSVAIGRSLKFEEYARQLAIVPR
jgi:RimJ/RimL family protein N-acetyltransferase